MFSFVWNEMAATVCGNFLWQIVRQSAKKLDANRRHVFVSFLYFMAHSADI